MCVQVYVEIPSHRGAETLVSWFIGLRSPEGKLRLPADPRGVSKHSREADSTAVLTLRTYS